jgi:hypothetical protein
MMRIEWLTSGVLTKADTLEKSTEGVWLEIINGIAHPATYGYYVTRLMSPHERARNMSWGRSRRREDRFFQKRLWRGVQENERLGTENLVAALSSQLTKMISARFYPLRLS